MSEDFESWWQLDGARIAQLVSTGRVAHEAWKEATATQAATVNCGVQLVVGQARKILTLEAELKAVGETLDLVIVERDALLRGLFSEKLKITVQQTGNCDVITPESSAIKS